MITSDDDDHRLSPTTHVATSLCVISKTINYTTNL